MITKETITLLVQEFIADTDMYIVDITVSASANIEVCVDSMDGIAIERCVKLSRHIESNLDREKQDFALTVASAGLSEPFRVKQQYVKNIGKVVSVVLITGQKLVGILTAVEEDSIDLQCEEIIKEGPKGKKKKVEVNKKILFADIKNTFLEIIFK